MGQLLLDIVVKFVESHPDQVAELLHEAVTAGINALKKHNQAAEAAGK